MPSQVTEHELRIELAGRLYAGDVTTAKDHIWIKSKHGAGYFTFHPETNLDQLELIENWILREHIMHFAHRNNIHDNDGFYISFQKAPQGRFPKSYFFIKHDNTIQGIRSAKIQGALTILRHEYEKIKGGKDDW